MIRAAALALALAMGATAAHAQEVVATNIGPYIGGALVCQTGDAIQTAAELLQRDAELRLMDPASRRNYEAMYGSAHFDPQDIGCDLVPTGTRMRIVEQLGVLYHVTGSGYDGYAMIIGLALAN